MQRRSIERVRRLLDACAVVLDDVGYDALTTREVARRAEVPIGTLYQFFGGKQSLCAALGRRNLEVWVERLHGRLSTLRVSRWSQTTGVVIEEFVTMKRTMPGFAVVDFGDTRSVQPVLLDGTEQAENNDFVAARLARFAVDDLGLPDAADLELVLRVAVELTDGLLGLAFRIDRQGDPKLIAEAETALRAYLSDRLG